MSELVFAIIAYLLLLPVFLIAPMKLSFKHKVLISSGSLFLTIFCILATSVIPLYQTSFIFALLLLLSTYILETRLRPLFFHSTKASKYHFTFGRNGMKGKEIEVNISPVVKAEAEKVGYINGPSIHIVPPEDKMVENSDVISNQENREVSPQSINESEDEWVDLERQLQDWNPPTEENDFTEYGEGVFSTLSKEEEVYHRLFSEMKN